jgi:hypothetical protein
LIDWKAGVNGGDVGCGGGGELRGELGGVAFVEGAAEEGVRLGIAFEEAPPKGVDKEEDDFVVATREGAKEGALEVAVVDGEE